MGSARRSFIGGSKLPESKRAWLGLALVSVALSCGSGPRVSPWGPDGTVPLRLYAEAPDLDARGRSIDDETGALGLRLESETAIADRSGTRFLVRGYVGDDSLGRPVHATRVASPLGVVLAVGPESETDVAPPATELVRALDTGSGRAVASPGDLDGDGTLELILRSRTGVLAIVSLAENGARDAAIDLAVPATELVDLGEDGVAVGGAAELADRDPALRPRLVDVAASNGGRYSNRAPAARSFHARERDRLASEAAPAAAGPRVRLEHALERAWHAILAGDDRDAALNGLDREPVPPDLRASFDAWTGLIRDRTR